MTLTFPDEVFRVLTWSEIFLCSIYCFPDVDVRLTMSAQSFIITE